MAGTILHSTFRLLLLLTVVVFTAVGSRNDQASLEKISGFATTPKSKDNTEIVTATRKDELRKPSTVVSNAEPENEKGSWGEKAEDDEQDDDEGDEYEEELREIAESHEAMSRDERRNGISNSPAAIELVKQNVKDRLEETKNFDSHEKSTEYESDESSLSNEAIPENEDKEVAELLKYKQMGTLVKEDVVGELAEPGLKSKRVPTVKKELSTQKEIIASNETFVKNLVANGEIANRLDQETKKELRFSAPVRARDSNRYEPVRGDISLEEEYTDVDTQEDQLRKLDKRHPTEMKGFNSYFLDGYAREQEQQRKLQEMGIEDGILAESLMEILTRLAEDPRRWERVHQILQEVEEDLELTRTSLPDSKKRAYSSDSLLEIPLTESSSPTPIKPPTTKKPKKKKKKKKPRHRFASTTSTTTSPTISTTPTPIPFTPPLLTTTESPWPTTPAQWRLVAERLFGSPWTDDRLDSSSSNLAKVRYSATSKQRGSSGSLTQDRSSPIDEKQRESLKTLNDERQALMLQSAREYSQPRRLHYGKVNTHENGSPGSSQDNSPKKYDPGSAARVLDYDLPERSYQRPMTLDRYDRYGPYNRQRPGDYGINPVNHQQEDYDEMFRFPEGITNRRPFARTQPFRPLGREYASTKTWQDSRYDYSRPWKDKSRTNLDEISAAGANWPWRPSQSNYKIWVPRYQPWPRERSYPHRISDVDDELEDIEEYVDNDRTIPRNWQINSQQQSWRTFPDNSPWPIEASEAIPSWPVPERPKSYTREILPVNLEKNKNLSELNGKDVAVKTPAKDKPMLPKITMKTWNSLTSDPATWPFKLNGAKPWPKDKNGKSYNPNAELVRELGLDKQDRLLSSTKDSSKDNSKETTKFKAVGLTGTNTQDEKVTNSEKNGMSWPDKLSGVNEWNNEKQTDTDSLPQRDEVRQVWQSNVDGDRKMWSGKEPVSSKISSVSSWVIPADQSTWKPYEIKHPDYSQIPEATKSRWSDRTNNEDSGTIPWSPQKINNDWNSGTSGFSAGKSAAPVTSHSSTWPSKWRQFAYHKVTAAPITKPGSSNPSEGTSRSRNAYIAVSAVSPPKYLNNEWRKNDVEETQLDHHLNEARFDQDDPSSQLRKNKADKVWNQQKETTGNGKDNNREKTPLELLEEVRHIPYWKHEDMRDQQKGSTGNGKTNNRKINAREILKEVPPMNYWKHEDIRDQQKEFTGNGKTNNRKINARELLEEVPPMLDWKQEGIRDQSQKRSNASGVTTVTTSSTQASFLQTNSTTNGNEKSEKKLEENPVTNSPAQQKNEITK